MYDYRTVADDNTSTNLYKTEGNMKQLKSTNGIKEKV